ncbi:MAG TPA: type II toxin-antitoxin system VapC family toxin [Verrucomicrobiae bacterium]|jgi:predicted nucleic acid-binding protein|nr:type II toxin-antitoxin system VapC family toxin [Verrucomicrobiae bacterium]
MIADTTFLSDMVNEQRRNMTGPALTFFTAHRRERLRTTIISAGEVLILFETNADGWAWLARWTMYRLHQGIADEAANIDREQIAMGRRLGENDNWIAGFARYFREPIISRDAAFDRVEGLRRISY